MTGHALEEFQENQKADDAGAVYFVQVGNDGLIKIGFSRKHPALRVASLQQASPYILTWIGFMPALPAKEKELHDRFADYRFRSEWFHPVAPLREFINSACPAFDPMKSRWESLRFDVLEEIRAFVPHRNRAANWDFVVCLEHIGIPRADFWSWRGGAKAPTDEFITGLRKALDLYRKTYLGERLAA